MMTDAVTQFREQANAMNKAFMAKRPRQRRGPSRRRMPKARFLLRRVGVTTCRIVDAIRRYNRAGVMCNTAIVARDTGLNVANVSTRLSALRRAGIIGAEPYSWKGILLRPEYV